jgi:hypothetical protein
MAGTQFLIVLGGGALLLGLACVIWIVRSKRRNYGTPNWPRVVGRILDVSVATLARETPAGMVTTFTPMVRYEYAVEGEIYVGQRVHVSRDERLTTQRRSEADRRVARYGVNDPVDVFYNPVVPQQAALVLPRPVAHNAVLFFGVANAVMGALMIVLGIVLL